MAQFTHIQSDEQIQDEGLQQILVSGKVVQYGAVVKADNVDTTDAMLEASDDNTLAVEFDGHVELYHFN